MPLLATAERVVKCPTGHCPGWITVDDERPQTPPCRYCRVTVNTLSFLLESTSETAAAPQMPAAVHETFNGLLLKLAGQTGGNVYLRPIDRTIVSLVPSTRGVIIEYNPVIARLAGPAAIVALILHHLLHIEQHPRQEKPLGMLLRAGTRDKEAMQPVANYLLTLVDHAWITPRVDAVDPALGETARAWGLDVAALLTGNETFFPPYMAERNRRWISDQFAEAGADSAAVGETLVARLASLSARFFAGQRDDLRRNLLAVQLADLGLRDPARQAPYAAALEAAGVPNVAVAAGTATRLVTDIAEVRADSASYDAIAYRRGLDAALKALGLQTVFEVQTLKSA